MPQGVLLASFGQSSDAAKHLKMALHIEPTHANAAKHLEDQEEQLKKMRLKDQLEQMKEQLKQSRETNERSKG